MLSKPDRVAPLGIEAVAGLVSVATPEAMEMHTDRELLELAAKAAGYEFEIDHHGKFHVREGTGPQSWAPWNPLADYGDALRLAVTTRLKISVASLHAIAIHYTGAWADAIDEPFGDPYAATCRAIVRAAAAIAQQTERVKGETK